MNCIEKGFENLFTPKKPFFGRLLDLVYPSDAGCVICSAQHPMAKNALPLCQNCFLEISGRGILKQSASCFTYASCRHEGVARRLIIMLKFRNARYLAESMGIFAARGIRLTGKEYDMLTGVPLSAERMKERGYNQAALIADAAGMAAGIPSADLLCRVRDTARQTALGGRERISNVKGAFKIKPGVDIAGKRIMLVDDVLTTGATLAECRKALLAVGAKYVDMLVFSYKELGSGEIEGDGFDD